MTRLTLDNSFIRDCKQLLIINCDMLTRLSYKSRGILQFEEKITVRKQSTFSHSSTCFPRAV